MLQRIKLPRCMSSFSLARHAKSWGCHQGFSVFQVTRAHTYCTTITTFNNASRAREKLFVFLLSPARLRARDTPKTSQYRGSSECFYRSIILFTLNVSSIASAVVDVLDLHAAQDATAGQPRTPGTKKMIGRSLAYGCIIWMH